MVGFNDNEKSGNFKDWGCIPNWNLEGMNVWGTYLNVFPVGGKVTESRVKYGGGVCHTVQLNSPISVFGAIRDTVILEHSEISGVRDGRD